MHLRCRHLHLRDREMSAAILRRRVSREREVEGIPAPSARFPAEGLVVMAGRPPQRSGLASLKCFRFSPSTTHGVISEKVDASSLRFGR